MSTVGLLGRKLSHSRSPELFAEIFAREGLAHWQYLLWETEDLPATLAWLRRQPDVVGANVTIPYKQAIVPMLDSLSPEAEAIGAVNTVVFERPPPQVFTRGHNTDAAGFAATLDTVGYTGNGPALVLGTGGAARAVCWVLAQRGIAFRTVGRQPGKGHLTYLETAKEIAHCPLIVNATPLGMWPEIDTAPPIDYDDLTAGHTCIDLVYNPAETLFMKHAAAQGAKTTNGTTMLRQQAEAAWRLWRKEIG